MKRKEVDKRIETLNQKKTCNSIPPKKNDRKTAKEYGFSLLEISIAVGVLLVLTMSGALAFRGQQENPKQSAVNNAAESVYSKAFSTLSDEQNDTSPEQVEEEYNKSSEDITVEVDEISSGRLQVKAFYKQNSAISQTLTTPASGNGSNIGENTGGENNGTTPEKPLIEDVITTVKMRCDNDTTLSVQPFMGIQEGAEITVQEVGKPETIQKVSISKYEDYTRALFKDYYTEEQIDEIMDQTLANQTLEMQKLGISEDVSTFLGYLAEGFNYKANVEYELTINGKFNILQGGNCFRAIDFADDSGLVQAYFGAYVEDVSPNLPNSVVRLANAFQLTKNFNDPDISEWDTSNVKDMNSMFYGAEAFNQPLNNWDVSNVTDMYNMFYSADSFNQPLNNWDTGKVENMNSMFSFSVFNQNIDSWNTSKVTDMGKMFSSTTEFNSPLGSWDVSNVKNMKGMFQKAQKFNQPLNNWDTSNVEDMSYMFSQAQKFNQPLDGWNVSNVSNATSMFFYAPLFSQNLSSWKFTKIPSKASSFSSLSPQDKLPKEQQPQWGAS